MTFHFDTVATGGTFDEIHLGHVALLRRAFELGSRVIIGISSDDFAKLRGKRLNNDYKKRVAILESTIKREFGDVNYEIARLDGEFGPAVTNGDVDALVCSKETQEKGTTLNEIRAKNQLKPVEVIVVELVTAEDGGKISSSRIRAGEIDRYGRVLSRYRRNK